MSDFTLISPSIAETQLTGFLCAGEKTIRGAAWRVEFWGGQPLRILRNGAAVSWESATLEAKRLAHAVANFVNSAAAGVA